MERLDRKDGWFVPQPLGSADGSLRFGVTGIFLLQLEAFPTQDAGDNRDRWNEENNNCQP
jgi:hypothetical protein